MEHFVTAELVPAAECCALVTVSLTKVSYLFQLVRVMEGHAEPVLLDEIPIVQ